MRGAQADERGVQAGARGEQAGTRGCNRAACARLGVLRASRLCTWCTEPVFDPV